MFHSVATAFFISLFLSSVQATIYVDHPITGDQCHGGQTCDVQWSDDGVAPLLSNIGPCHVGLYNGNNVLVQQISPVDVSAVHSLSFTPDPKAGPNSGAYYIKFTAVNPVGGKTFNEYSPFFTLSGMSGSFSSPVSSDTAPISVPSSVASHTPSSVSTIFVSSSVSGSSSASSGSGSSSSHSSGSSSVSTPSSSISPSHSSSASSSISLSSSPTPTAPSSSISASSLSASSSSLSGFSSSRASSISSSASGTPTGSASGAPKTISGQASVFVTAFALLAIITLPLV